MRFGVIAAVVVAIALALSVCASDKEAITATATDAVQVDTIVDVAVGIGDFTTLAAALTAAGLLATLSRKGPFTVFAATDDATIKTVGVTPYPNAHKTVFIKSTN